MCKTSFFIFTLLFTGFILSIPKSEALEEWNYENYLYSFEILSHEAQVTAGQATTVTIQIGANTEVDLHIELKGMYEWGSWTFSEVIIFLEEGLANIDVSLEIPLKTVIEYPSEFYIYVYASSSGDSWSTLVWGLTQMVTIDPPSEVTHEELKVCMSHLKWLIDTSTLSDDILQSLFSKLELAGIKINEAFSLNELNLLNGAISSLNSFVNELSFDDEASQHESLETWKKQVDFIIERLEEIFD